jgi:hypothetical protein
MPVAGGFEARAVAVASQSLIGSRLAACRGVWDQPRRKSPTYAPCWRRGMLGYDGEARGCIIGISTRQAVGRRHNRRVMGGLVCAGEVRARP